MRNKNFGFTLIELLVVIAVIGILAALIVVSIGGSRNRARDSRRMSDLRQIQSAQEMVMGDDRNYKKSAGAVGVIPEMASVQRQYLTELSDPLDNDDYKYIWVGNDEVAGCAGFAAGNYYCALAKLEEKKQCGNVFRYFMVNNKGSKEICSAVDFVANPPDCVACMAL